MPDDFELERLTVTGTFTRHSQPPIGESPVSDNFDLPAPKIKAPVNVWPTVAVCPFTIIIDTREQLPYHFDSLGLFVPVSHRALVIGDYSIQGAENFIAIERKSLADLYGSVTHGRDRFEREIQRLDAMCKFAAVSIEATWAEIADPESQDPAWDNQTRPESVLGTIAAWSIRYPQVHWWPVGTRAGCELQIFRTFKMWWKDHEPEGP